MASSLTPFLRPAMKIKAHGIHSDEVIPRPSGQAPERTPGTFPDQVLLLGNGPLAGWGVRRHADAIPGHLARELTARTGHATEVHLRMEHTTTCETSDQLLDGLDLSEYDAIVVIIGASDALQLLSPSRWDTAVRKLLGRLQDGTPGPTDIVILGIQPPSTVPVFHIAHGGVVDQRATEFNSITRTYCTGRVHFLPPPLLRRVGPTDVNPTRSD
jgi:hypothetical protein